MAEGGALPGNDPRRLLASVGPPEAGAAKPDNGPALRKAAWLGLLAAGAVAVIAILPFARDEVVTLAWSEGGMGKPAEADWAGLTSPDHLEIVSEHSLHGAEPDDDVAYQAAKRATELDPSRASAWATLAYIETRRQQGVVNQAAIEALTKSMDACPLCDAALIRWRFNFVLTHWAAMPEAIRRRAFEHADLLRWIGPHAEFLAEMRFKARLHGIPFDDYRAAVDTPARSWDIAPAPQALEGQGPAG